MVLLALAALWLPFLPNAAGRIGADYELWLPNLLAGTYWHVQNPFWQVPWFNPSLCGGAPFEADPQAAYFSIVQFLAFVVPPLRAVQASFFVYAAAGFLGIFHLARRHYRIGVPAAVMAAALFACNGFFATRVIVGHLSFAPFMLVPAAATCLLGEAQRGRPAVAREIVRCGSFALIVAVMLEAGMMVLVPPAYLALLMLVAFYVVVADRLSAAPLLRLAAGTLLALLLCAGKLAAMLSLLSNLPRDGYPLPGFRNALVTVMNLFAALFWTPVGRMPTDLVNTAVPFGPHEFSYCIGPVPLVLSVAGLAMLWRRGWRPGRAQQIGLAALGLTLLVPIAVNTYAPGWNALLKHLPIIRNSSSLLRWFAAYLPLCALFAGLALDGLTGGRRPQSWRIAAFGVLATLGFMVFADRSPYGPEGLGAYDPAPIDAAWRQSAATGAVPPIREIVATLSADGQPDLASLVRQDGMARGASQLYCYDALFGYRLENFPQGALHAGSIFATTPAGGPGGARLNLKNPACYVFPGANACKPGDAFAATDLDRARLFASWKAFPWNKPVWAYLADWVGILGWVLIPVAICTALAALSRDRVRQAPSN